jgi:hypothetical protein
MKFITKRDTKFFLVALITAALFVCSCKKKTTPQQTAPVSHPSTSITVDDTVIPNQTHTSYSSTANYNVISYASGGNPEIQITFKGAPAPNNGTYLIANGTPAYGYCSFTFSNAAGTSSSNSGYVTISAAAAPYNTVTFSNITVGGTAGSHVISGTITY